MAHGRRARSPDPTPWRPVQIARLNRSLNHEVPWRMPRVGPEIGAIHGRLEMAEKRVAPSARGQPDVGRAAAAHHRLGARCRPRRIVQIDAVDGGGHIAISSAQLVSASLRGSPCAIRVLKSTMTADSPLSRHACGLRSPNTATQPRTTPEKRPCACIPRELDPFGQS